MSTEVGLKATLSRLLERLEEPPAAMSRKERAGLWNEVSRLEQQILAIESEAHQGKGESASMESQAAVHPADCGQSGHSAEKAVGVVGVVPAGSGGSKGRGVLGVLGGWLRTLLELHSGERAIGGCRALPGVAEVSEPQSQAWNDESVFLECTAHLSLTGFSSGNTLRDRTVVFGGRRITYSPQPRGYWPLVELSYDEITKVQPGGEYMDAMVARASGQGCVAVWFIKRGGDREECLSITFRRTQDAARCERILRSAVDASKFCAPVQLRRPR